MQSRRRENRYNRKNKKNRDRTIDKLIHIGCKCMTYLLSLIGIGFMPFLIISGLFF